MRQIIDLANKVLLERERQGLTQTDLAKKAGVNRPWLVQFESGRGNPTFRSIVAVLSALDLEIDVIPARAQAPGEEPVDLERLVSGFAGGDEHGVR